MVRLILVARIVEIGLPLLVKQGFFSWAFRWCTSGLGGRSVNTDYNCGKACSCSIHFYPHLSFLPFTPYYLNHCWWWLSGAGGLAERLGRATCTGAGYVSTQYSMVQDRWSVWYFWNCKTIQECQGGDGDEKSSQGEDGVQSTPTSHCH